ncbi:hypothetical protein AX774_g7207 [Zancudomyces culisetae]|uniref:Uncharacterized protein n=1 Tax=Zancudomyces culisetae TaxID=1213189 RepID=A0A1R1PEI0_ZANCU|nr:hypothetical protein AX774_g7207 [Zancudomyces culisetae]|eukprot:OMH79377.1 hypothetical protein AX774_g7207 [Zancudomyces culisetae]
MKHRVTQETPAKMLYGFNISTPINWSNIIINENEEEAIVERLSFIRDELPTIGNLAVQKIIKNKQYEKTRYDKNIKDYKFKDGEIV